MKQNSVDIQVDFDKPRVMPPTKGSNTPCRAVGYFQYFYCSDKSKDKAKQLAIDFVIANEADPETCRMKCDRIAWMRGLMSKEQLAVGQLTQEMFDRRQDHGIWYHSDKQYYVSEVDYAASITEEDL